MTETDLENLRATDIVFEIVSSRTEILRRMAEQRVHEYLKQIGHFVSNVPRCDVTIDFRWQDADGVVVHYKQSTPSYFDLGAGKSTITYRFKFESVFGKNYATTNLKLSGVLNTLKEFLI